MTETSAGSTNVSPRTVVVDVRDTGPYGSNLIRDCNTIILNAYLSAGDPLRAAAAHEMGHALGLYHSGKWDSFVGDTSDPYPVMATCLQRIERSNPRVRADDRAALEFFHGGPRFDRYGQAYAR